MASNMGNESNAQQQQVSDENDDDELLLDPAYILRNLALSSEEAMCDATHTLQCRNIAAEMIINQLMFYFYCVFKAYTLRTPDNVVTDNPPNVLIFGSGFIGSKIINRLCENRCGPLLKIYTRGDVTAKYWLSKGIKASNSIDKLIPNEQSIDVIIMTTGSYTFQSMIKLLKPYINRDTALLYASFGLSAQRIYNCFTIPSIFRAYVEPNELVAKCHETFTNYVSSYQIYNKRQAFNRSVDIIDYSCDIMANRLGNVCNLIYILENYYYQRCGNTKVARYEALDSLLGFKDISMKEEILLEETKLVVVQDATPVRTQLIQSILSSCYQDVGINFQKALSRYVKIVDLPSATVTLTDTQAAASEARSDAEATTDAEDSIFDDASLFTDRGKDVYCMHSDVEICKLLNQDIYNHSDNSEITALLSEFGIYGNSYEAEANPFEGYNMDENIDHSSSHLGSNTAADATANMIAAITTYSINSKKKGSNNTKSPAGNLRSSIVLRNKTIVSSPKYINLGTKKTSINDNVNGDDADDDDDDGLYIGGVAMPLSSINSPRYTNTDGGAINAVEEKDDL